MKAGAEVRRADSWHLNSKLVGGREAEPLVDSMNLAVEAALEVLKVLRTVSVKLEVESEVSCL